jgi:hypothetical protein
MTRSPVLRIALAAVLTFVAARGALHLATYSLPLSNDDAVPVIQARLLLQGELVTTLINQPYNGTLDTWLLAPLVALLPAHTAFRIYELLAAAALVALAAWLAHRTAGLAAAWAAALATAFGTPYMGMMTAIGRCRTS